MQKLAKEGGVKIYEAHGMPSCFLSISFAINGWLTLTLILFWSEFSGNLDPGG